MRFSEFAASSKVYSGTSGWGPRRPSRWWRRRLCAASSSWIRPASSRTTRARSTVGGVARMSPAYPSATSLGISPQ